MVYPHEPASILNLIEELLPPITSKRSSALGENTEATSTVEGRLNLKTKMIHGMYCWDETERLIVRDLNGSVSSLALLGRLFGRTHSIVYRSRADCIYELKPMILKNLTVTSPQKEMKKSVA